VIDAAVAAIRAGEPVVLPTDTVYGLCAEPTAEAAKRVARLKGREERQPTALLAPSVETLLELVPESPEALLRALLPGPLTLILPNPKRRYPWLGGNDTIGVRVPDLPAQTTAVLDEVGAVLATSANLHGGLDPRRLEDVPEAIHRAAGAVVDAGELPGTPSTVLDLTRPEPRVLREGAVPAAEALSRARAAGARGAGRR
jgi:L-threonylcarbamoyladenylate synthase